jgi:hypothetical protein
LFERGYYRNRGHNTNKLTWVHVPVRVDLTFQKLSKTEEWQHGRSICFEEEITGTKATILKNYPCV